MKTTKIEIHDETYEGLKYLCTRVVRGNKVRWAGRWWIVRRSEDGQVWVLGCEA